MAMANSMRTSAVDGTSSEVAAASGCDCVIVCLFVTFMSPMLQDTHNLELELPEEEESRVPSPSFRHTTAAVDQLMLGMPLNQKETVGSMVCTCEGICTGAALLPVMVAQALE